MFIWFVNHYGKTTYEDCEANCQRMAAEWHPANQSDVLVLRLYSGAAFAGCTSFAMNDHDIVDIGLRVIKCSGMYANEYKAWIACRAMCHKILKNLDLFKMFWSTKITLVNQTTIPASRHGYGMATINDGNASIALYGKSITNFGAAYAATQESVRSQGSTITSLQGQVNAMQQYCMTIQQHPPPTNYVMQQQCGPNNCRGCHDAMGETAGAEPAINNLSSKQQMEYGLPCAHQPRTHGTRIGVTATCTVAKLTTATPAPSAPSLAQCTTPTQPTPTPWADQWRE
jgi:hypothetical protein